MSLCFEQNGTVRTAVLFNENGNYTELRIEKLKLLRTLIKNHQTSTQAARKVFHLVLLEFSVDSLSCSWNGEV